MSIVLLVLLVPLLLACIAMICVLLCLLYQGAGGRTLQPIESYPRIGVMIPHFNEELTYLLRSLEAIEHQDYPQRLTVYLVDDGSTTGVARPLAEWLSSPRHQHYVSIRFEENSGRKGRALDAALPSVGHDIGALVVLDSDTYLGEGSVRRVVERMWQDDNCAAVCGFVVPAPTSRSLIERLQYFEHVCAYPAVKCAQDVVGYVSVMAGAFVLHRMSALRQVGGWGRWIVEDIAWTWKALAKGYHTGYAPTAVAYTYGPTTARGLLKQRRRWARGRVEAFRATWEVSALRGLLATPIFCIWVLNLLPPTLFLLPVLAILLQQWWVLGVILGAAILSVVLFQVYQLRLPEELRTGYGDVLRALGHNTLFDVFLWCPNVLGFCDEVVGKRKAWLTR